MNDIITFCEKTYTDISKIAGKVFELAKDEYNLYDHYFCSFLEESEFLSKLIK